MIALFIGRFQPFHLGHLDAIKQIKADKIIIGIGSSQYNNTENNPFTANQRMEMIKATLQEDYNHEVFLIPDIHNDEKWVDYVCQIVPQFDSVYTGNPKTKKLFEEKDFQVKAIKLVPNISGTIIRNMMVNNQDYSQLVPTQVLKIIKNSKN
ncbi:nicotinamide-nucleotide adenylyltransferase [Nanoarchaeota archaeon]